MNFFKIIAGVPHINLTIPNNFAAWVCKIIKSNLRESHTNKFLDCFPIWLWRFDIIFRISVRAAFSKLKQP